MNIGYPIVAIVNGRWLAATVTRRVPDAELSKGVDMAADLAYFDTHTRSWHVLERVPYFNGPDEIPSTGEYFIECGADTNDERRAQAAQREKNRANFHRFATLKTARETRELTAEEAKELAALQSLLTMDGQATAARPSGAAREVLEEVELSQVGAKHYAGELNGQGLELGGDETQQVQALSEGANANPDDEADEHADRHDANLPIG